MASKAVNKAEQAKNGLLPTPPMPKGLPEANLTDNARQVLMKRYEAFSDELTSILYRAAHSRAA